MNIAESYNPTIPKVDSLLKYSENYGQTEIDLSMDLALKAYALSEKLNYGFGKAKSNYCIARYYLTRGDVEKSIVLLNKSIEEFQKGKHFKDLAQAYSLKSIVFGRLLQYNNAIEELQKAITIFEGLNDSKGQIKCLLNISIEYLNLKDFENARLALNKVERLDALHSKGLIEFYLPVNYGSLYYEQGIYDTALIYFEKSYKDADSLNIPDAKVSSLHYLGLTNKKLGRHSKALGYLQTSLLLAKKYNLDDETLLILRDLTDFYHDVKDFEKAFLNYKAYIQLRDTVYGLEKINRIADLEKKLEVEKRENIIKLKNSEIKKGRAEIKTGYYKIIAASVISVLIFSVSLIVFFFYKKTKILNTEITLQKLRLEEKNRDIMESIHYAKRIQTSILPSEKNLTEILQNYFVFFKPKDVVSGDFYWVYRTSANKIVFAVLDCTGHGVPGALMSMVGNGLLNEIVIENKVDKADEILNNLKAGLIKTLDQKKEWNSKDGMDMALCVLDKDTNVLEFSGANNSLYLVRQDEQALKNLSESNPSFNYCGNGLLEIKGDKQSIAFEEEKAALFSRKELQLYPNDQLYIYTDGFADQFGGERNKKFTYKKFREILVAISQLPAQQQKDDLEKEFTTWKSDNEQVDDICVLGLKI